MVSRHKHNTSEYGRRVCNLHISAAFFVFIVEHLDLLQLIMDNYLDTLQQISHLRERKDYLGSIALCKELSADPNAPMHIQVHAHLDASGAYRLLHQYSEAQVEAQAAKTKNTDPQNQHFILFELASVLESAGNWAQAATTYQEAASSPIAPVDDYGLKDRYLEHSAWALAHTGDATGMSKLLQSISDLEKHLLTPDITKESGQFDRKYNLQVWLSKSYMHAWELGDKSIGPKLDALLASNPLLKIRRDQWQELKSKA